MRHRASAPVTRGACAHRGCPAARQTGAAPGAGPDIVAAERVVLGTAIAYPGATREMVEHHLEPNDFHSDEHQAVLAALRALQPGPDDPQAAVRVVHHLMHADVRPSSATSWPALVAELLTVATVPAALPAYMPILRHAHVVREAAQLARALRDRINDGDKRATREILTATVAAANELLTRLDGA